jgi:eukaryotic-like serine/threonine-protein kinase
MTAWTIPSYAEWAVPGYTEERLLGHGVSGRVVAAASEATGRRVAIKYFDASLVRDPGFLDEFRSEAERLRSLDAPHAVRIYDFVEQPGEGAAVVTDLVDGVSLREMISRKGPLGPQAALVVLKDSLLGLAAAHAQRVPHRDLKPDNVLIDTSGWCTLTDFGVAVKTDKQVPAAGTPAYMAPELWNGAPNVPSTDLYAATAVLFESLTGKPPFSGRAGHLGDQHQSAPVPVDRVDEPLQGLIEWGMAKKPVDRPRSARSFAAELEALAAAAYGPYWEDQGRRQLGERTSELLPLLLAEGGGGSATATRLARRKVLTYASIGAVALVLLGAVGAVALSKQSDNAKLSSITAAAFTAQATVTPPVAVSKCTTATTFTYGGTVTATIPGTLTYQWLYSSGKPGAVQTLKFAAAGHRTVTGETVKATKATSGWAELKVLTPAAKTSNKATYKLLCGSGANGGIAVSASVRPAAQTVSSCGGKAPSLTASGQISSKKAGKVTYYWALGTGQNAGSGTVTFSAPGTKAVTPLTFRPPALPANGDAVLVATWPSAAASRPVAYSVSCTVPVTVTPSASVSAHGSAPASGTAPAKSSPSPGRSTAAPTGTATTSSPAGNPTTAPPTTAPPTTAPPTTAPPTTAPPTTAPPTTAPPTTAPPTTAPPTTAPPTTAPPTTSAPTGTATATST